MRAAALGQLAKGGFSGCGAALHFEPFVEAAWTRGMSLVHEYPRRLFMTSLTFICNSVSEGMNAV